MTGPIRYLDRASIGALFGVSAAAVAKWQERDQAFPAPDVLLGDRELPGWAPAREAEIRAWHAARPSQGRPGQSKPGSGRRRQSE